MNRFLSRRFFILIPFASILKVIFKPQKVFAASADDFIDYKSLSKEEWRQRLSPEAFYILREEGTERPFTSNLNNEKREGSYHCVNCEVKLFESNTKYESGSGWPSFFNSLPNVFETKTDNLLGYPRTEYHCKNCGGHHGHIFEDGPDPTGKRFCNNGVCLTFKPK